MSNRDIHNIKKILRSDLSYRLNRMFNNRVHSRWGFENRINQDQHLIYVKSGEGFYIIEGREHPLREGQLILVSRGTIHSSGFRGNNRPEILPIRFSIMKDHACADHLISSPFSLIRNVDGKEIVEPLLYKLFNLYTRKGEGSFKEEKISSIIRLLLLMLTEEERKEESNSRISGALERIHSSPWEKQNLDDLAAICNLSAKQFSRLFKKETDRNPMDYIRFFRCQYAAEELHNSSLSIKEISHSLGYPDPYTFSKQFKRYMGQSPREWRRNSG